MKVVSLEQRINELCQKLEEKDQIILNLEKELKDSKKPSIQTRGSNVTPQLQELQDQNEKLKQNLKKEEETVSFMFKRAKELSALISDFHQNEIQKLNLNVTQEHILSYNSSI